MHTRTIVQNKILSIICSCSFFCPTNINWPNLVNVWLVTPNPNDYESPNFHTRNFFKQAILLQNGWTTMQQSLILNFIQIYFFK